MNIDQVITQLRTYCAALGTRVGGAADFAVGTENVISFTDPITGRLAYPAAVVVPLDDDAGENVEWASGLTQIVTERVAVIVEFDSTADRRGQGGVDQVQAMKYALHGALLDWNPSADKAARGIYYSGGQLLSFDRARLFWQFVYALDVTLTDGDGFQPRGDPLTDITAEISVADGAPGNGPLIEAEILPPVLPT